METGTITGREITTNLDAEKKTLLLQVLVADENDGQTVELQNQSGEDVEPPDGSRVFIMDVSDSFRVVVAVDDGIEPDSSIEQGERETYSSDGGERKAKIRWKKDGQIVLNDGGDTAVKYSELKTAFDQLKSDFDDLVNAYNAHIHITTATIGVGGPGVIAPTTSAGAPTIADITPAESGTVNLP